MLYQAQLVVESNDRKQTLLVEAFLMKVKSIDDCISFSKAFVQSAGVVEGHAILSISKFEKAGDSDRGTVYYNKRSGHRPIYRIHFRVYDVATMMAAAIGLGH